MESFRTEIYPDHPSGDKLQATTPRQILIELVQTIALAMFLFFGINTITARIRVESVSMQPTLYAGDFVIVNKLAYKMGSPTRGDVLIFRYPPDPDREPYIKRAIGLPGDIITVKGGKVSVNGQPLDEPYISAAPNYEGSWIVPQDSLFMLGDNRNRSSDSHSWGMVPLENVIGKAMVVYWPPQDWQVLNPATAIAAQQ